MSAQNRLIIDIDLNDDQALSKLRTAFGNVEKTSQQATDSMNLSWAGFASKLFVVQQAMAPVIDFMKGAIKAANEQTDAINRLNIALKNQGTFTQSVSESYARMADSMSRSSVFADDAIMGVQQQLVALGNVGPESMERVVQATLDLATQTGNLEQAALLMAKASQGNTTALGRFGISIDENTPKAERLEAVLQLLEKRFKGMAEEATKAGSGPLKQLGKSFGELQEQIGLAVTESESYLAVIQAITGAFYKLADAISLVRDLKRLDPTGPEAQARLNEYLTGAPAGSRGVQPGDFSTIPGLSGGAADAASNPSVIQNQLVNQAIITQEQAATQQYIAEQDKRTQARLAGYTAETAAHQKKTAVDAQLNDQATKHDKISKQAQLMASKAKFETELAIGQATADLISAVATLSGKASIKAVAIVVQAVVTAVNIMLTATNPLLAILRIATTAIAATAAIQQLNQAEKAMEAIKSERIQPVTNIQGLATGGSVVRGGAFLVGERGPEMVTLPAGAAVTPNGGAAGMTFNIVINNPVMTTEEGVRSIAGQVAGMVSEYIDNERRRL